MIDITRDEGSISDGTYKLHLFYPVASNETYRRYWEKAIAETNAALFRENSKFTAKDLEQVTDELNRLIVWAKGNLTDTDLLKMTDRLYGLIDVITKSCEDADAYDCPFEIY